MVLASQNPVFARPALSQSAAQQPDCQLFRETGKNVCGRFLAYWREHGGLAQHGYPITQPFSERSDTNGKPYTVQYFERAVFEAHPENQAPYDVLLSLLGTALYKQKYPSGAGGQVANRTVGSLVFSQTGHHLGGTFLQYWQDHGGLAQQGYPVSDEFTERSDLDGKRYVVQYFERAVLELHPDYTPPYNVLLAQLGTMQMKNKYPAGINARALPPGSWGGSQVSLQVTASGATLAFSCAHGIIDKPLTLDSSGHFDAAGMYVRETGVALTQDNTQQAEPARYTGSTDGTTMNLAVTLAGNQRVGLYALTLDKPAKIVKCM
jgi:hypothetical protein